jgi:hypothetical protein
MSFQSSKLIIETDDNWLRSSFRRISTAFLTKSMHFFEDVCLFSFFPLFRIRARALAVIGGALLGFSSSTSD